MTRSERARWLVLGLALIVASLSYHFVETPFRARRWAASSRVMFMRSGFAMAALCVVAIAFDLSRGMPGRFSAKVVAADAARDPAIPFIECIGRTVEQDHQGGFCPLGDHAAPPTFWIWGDSHALAWAPAFDDAFKATHRGALLAVESACPPVLGIVNRSNLQCTDVNDAVFVHIRESVRINTVVLVAAWPAYANDGPYSLGDSSGYRGNERVFPPAFAATVSALHALGKRVWIVGPTPGGPPGILLWRALEEHGHVAQLLTGNRSC